MTKAPNVLVSGTPGTGKSTICRRLIEQLGDSYTYLNIAEYVKENNLYEEYDTERDCVVMDEDALIDHLDELVKKANKGLLFDYHGCDLFPPEWFQSIFVLRTANYVLYKRLEARNYSESKIRENIECEIFQTILDEAKEAFGEEEHIEIIELENDTEEDQTNNVNTILNWIKSKL